MANVKDDEKKIQEKLLNVGSLYFLLDYEIRSSWWAVLINWKWGQQLAGKYFAWKIKRKYARYLNLL